MTKTCETCKYWAKPDVRYNEHRNVRRCTKTVQLFDEEDGLVTCGNAVLGGSKLKNTTDVIKIEGL